MPYGDIRENKKAREDHPGLRYPRNTHRDLFHRSRHAGRLRLDNSSKIYANPHSVRMVRCFARYTETHERRLRAESRISAYHDHADCEEAMEAEHLQSSGK